MPPLERQRGAVPPYISNILTARHAARVARYYDTNTEPFYLHFWDREDIHFGLFERRSADSDLRRAVKRMTDAVVSPASIERADRVIDAGCGVGGAALDIAARVGCTVLGLTISPAQVSIARSRARQRRLGRVARFEVADCSRVLPARDGSVDILCSIEAACHFADKDRFVRECARVLRPGGCLALSDWMAADGTSKRDYAAVLQPLCDAWHLAGLDTPSACRLAVETSYNPSARSAARSHLGSQASRFGGAPA